MKKKMKNGLTASTFSGGCSNKESIQRPSIGGVSSEQNSEFTNSNTSDATSDSTSEIDSAELNNYQYYPLPDKTWAIAVGNNRFLEKLTVPKRYQGRMVTQIIDSGFKDCTSFKEISIPDSVTSIGMNAFSGCSTLSSIAIPEGITSIEDHAFSGCSSLENVVIPDSVTSIGMSAFENCTSLTGIVIPKSVTEIGDQAFYGCTSLTSIYCEAQSKPKRWSYSWKDLDCHVVWGCSGVGTTSSLNYKTDYKNGEKSITITKYIGKDSEVVIPETIDGIKVAGIGDRAFEKCTSLTSIVIPESVTTIKSGAFYKCNSLTSVVIPESVTTINYHAFYKCPNLLIYCKAESKPSGWIDDWKFWGRPIVWGYVRAGTYVVFEYAVTNMDGVESITITGYTGSDTSITIPETIDGIKVTAIANSAFWRCTSLTSIVISDEVTTIGEHAFDGCASLTSIVIPDGVMTIGDQAFKRCASLTSIVIPDGVTTIGDSAFSGCTSLTSIVIPGSVTTIGNHAFSGCTSLTGIVIPESVTEIRWNAFKECTNLTICCKAESKPSGWDSIWNPSNRPVVWGYKKP